MRALYQDPDGQAQSYDRNQRLPGLFGDFHPTQVMTDGTVADRITDRRSQQPLCAGVGARMWPQLLREQSETQRIKEEDQEAAQFWARGLGPTDLGDELAQVFPYHPCGCPSMHPVRLCGAARLAGCRAHRMSKCHDSMATASADSSVCNEGLTDTEHSCAQDHCFPAILSCPLLHTLLLP